MLNVELYNYQVKGILQNSETTAVVTYHICIKK